MTAPETITPEQRQNLVAYLDGELDERTAQSVAELLSTSAAARLELEKLQKTWDLLDYLPRPKASESFTNRTVQRLQTVRVTQQVRQRRLSWLGAGGWAAALIAGGALSFLAVNRQQGAKLPVPSANDLRVLEQRDYWPQFQRIDGIEFLRELDRPDLFGEDS